MRAFYEPALWITQSFFLRNPDFHHGLLDPDDFFLHKFRATFATKHLQAGVDLRTVQMWLGHKDMESTMRYLKPARGKYSDEGQRNFRMSRRLIVLVRFYLPLVRWRATWQVSLFRNRTSSRNRRGHRIALTPSACTAKNCGKCKKD